MPAKSHSDVTGAVDAESKNTSLENVDESLAWSASSLRVIIRCELSVNKRSLHMGCEYRHNAYRATATLLVQCTWAPRTSLWRTLMKDQWWTDYHH